MVGMASLWRAETVQAILNGTFQAIGGYLTDCGLEGAPPKMTGLAKAAVRGAARGLLGIAFSTRPPRGR